MKVKFKQKAILALIGICACFAPNLVLQTCAMEDKEPGETQTNSNFSADKTGEKIEWSKLTGDKFIDKLKEKGVICGLTKDVNDFFRKNIHFELPEDSVVLDWSKLKEQFKDVFPKYYGKKYVDPCYPYYYGYRVYRSDKTSDGKVKTEDICSISFVTKGGKNFDAAYFFEILQKDLFSKWITNAFNKNKIKFDDESLENSDYKSGRSKDWSCVTTFDGKNIHGFCLFNDGKETTRAVYMGSCRFLNKKDDLVDKQYLASINFDLFDSNSDLFDSNSDLLESACKKSDFDKAFVGFEYSL